MPNTDHKNIEETNEKSAVFATNIKASLRWRPMKFLLDKQLGAAAPSAQCVPHSTGSVPKNASANPKASDFRQNSPWRRYTEMTYGTSSVRKQQTRQIKAQGANSVV